MKPEFDRWVLPPAVAAAVFSVMAAVPPSGALDEALRVEGLQVGSSGPWLVRAAWEHPDTSVLRAPSRVTFSHAQRSVTALGAHGALFAWASLDAGALGAPSVMGVNADGRAVRVEITPHARIAMPHARRPETSLDVAVEGATLITEEPGVVLVRARGATAVRIEPEIDGVTVTPPRAEVDACGVARFEVRVEALGAPVRVVAEGSGASTSLRLPLRPGGLWARWNGPGFELRSAMGAGAVFVAGGARDGLTVWSELAWARDGDRAIARWQPPAGVEWAVASSVANFAEPSAAAREALAPSVECLSAASGQWFAAVESLPEVPVPEVLYDGVARGRAGQTKGRSRVRLMSFVGLALSVLAEAGLVLGAGLSGDLEELREVSENRRKRMGLLAAAVLTIAVAGMAFAVSGLIHAAD